MSVGHHASTRHGEERPEIVVWIVDPLDAGVVAAAHHERLPRPAVVANAIGEAAPRRNGDRNTPARGLGRDGRHREVVGQVVGADEQQLHDGTTGLLAAT